MLPGTAWSMDVKDTFCRSRVGRGEYWQFMLRNLGHDQTYYDIWAIVLTPSLCKSLWLIKGGA